MTLANIPTSGEADDHNVAGLWQRPDGRYLALYTGHNYGNGAHNGDTAPITFYRICTRPNDVTAWEPERQIHWPTDDPVGNGWVSVTYSNLHHLTAEGGEKGRLYNIARAAGQVWTLATSDDWGETWTVRGPLTLPPSGGRAYSNGYVKFWSNGIDRIDFLMTEAHPRDYNNGLYHGYIQGGKTHDSFGRVIDPDTLGPTGPQPEAFTPVWTPSQILEAHYHHGWTVQILRDPENTPCALFTTRFGTEVGPHSRTRPAPGDNDHRLFYARQEGDQWKSIEVCKMGPGLYDTEEDYTGLAAIDPRDGRTLFVSSPFDPHSGKPLDGHQLFKVMPDGEGWSWEPLTDHSGSQKLRPIAKVLKDGQLILLWLQGRYRSMHDYDQQVMARVFP
ncbi:MAG: BNR-4 repeat-containing protein [Opitutales bacterium]